MIQDGSETESDQETSASSIDHALHNDDVEARKKHQQQREMEDLIVASGQREEWERRVYNECEGDLSVPPGVVVRLLPGLIPDMIPDTSSPLRQRHRNLQLHSHAVVNLSRGTLHHVTLPQFHLRISRVLLYFILSCLS